MENCVNVIWLNCSFKSQLQKDRNNYLQLLLAILTFANLQPNGGLSNTRALNVACKRGQYGKQCVESN